MDLSIRSYNTNSHSRPSLGDEHARHSSVPLPEDEFEREEDVQSEPGVVDALPVVATVTQPEHTGQVDVADFEGIFIRYQVPITNFIYHLIGNREQAYDLAQDVFVKAYKALLGGTVVQPGALSAWLYRIASNTTTDTLRRRRLIAWLPLSLFNEDRGIGAGVISDSGGSADGFTTNSEESGGNDVRANSVSAMYERNGYDGGRF